MGLRHFTGRILTEGTSIYTPVDQLLYKCNIGLIWVKFKFVIFVILFQNGGNKKTKHAKFAEKTNISYPLIHTLMCPYQGVRNVPFLENFECFVFLLPPSRDSPFASLPRK